jgi:hypothetical protein
LKQDYDDFDKISGTRRAKLVKMIDNRMERVALAAPKMTERAGRRDRGTLGRERHTDEVHPSEDVIVVNLVETSQGTGYWVPD